MSGILIQTPFPIFNDIDGEPLEAGFIFIGIADLDPQVNPVAIFFDEALTQPAPQPIRTIGGYLVNSGTPTHIYSSGDYSIRVNNKNGSVIYSAPNASNFLTSSQFIQAGAGAVSRTTQSKLRESISVKDFGAVGDGTNESSKFQSAIDSLPATGGTVLVPSGVYSVTNIRLDGTNGDKSNVNLIGQGSASHLRKPDHSALFTNEDRRSRVVWALRGDGYQVRSLKVEGNLSRGGIKPPSTIRHQLGATFISAGRAISVRLDGTSSSQFNANDAQDRIFTITASGAGQVSSASNISADVSSGFVVEVTSQPFNEQSGAGFFNSFQLDNDFAYRAGIYMNGELSPMEGCVVHDCEVTDVIYGAILLGAGPLFASEAYFGTLQARITSNRCYGNTATHIGGGKKVKATISDNVLGETTSSGIRMDAGSDGCVVTGNTIDGNNVAEANGGVSVFQSDYVAVTGNFFRRCTTGITYNSCDFGTVSGNIVRECAVGIAYLQMDTGTISGNTVEGMTSDGIRVTGGSQVTVTGNAVLNSGAQGIEINDVPGCSVVANQVRGSTSTGIFISSSTQSTITGNVCRDNGSLAAPKAGIELAGTSNNCIVSANRCFDSRAGAARTQSFGIELGPSVDTSIVSANRLAGNLTGPISSVPSGCLVAHNGDADVQFNGTNVIVAETGGTTRLVDDNFQIQKGAGTIINRVVARGGAGGGPTAPQLSVEGTSVDIDLRITPKGTGMLRFGAHTVNADALVTGFVSIKDSGGIVRKLAVIA